MNNEKLKCSSTLNILKFYFSSQSRSKNMLLKININPRLNAKSTHQKIITSKNLFNFSNLLTPPLQSEVSRTLA